MARAPQAGRGDAALRFVEGLSRVLAAFRWLFMPVGLFALVAVGVHAGADVLDDTLLRALDVVDGALDSAVAAVLEFVCNVFRLGPERADAWSVAYAEAIGLPERAIAAKWLALALEVVADLLIALPALGYHETATATARLREMQSKAMRRFSTLVAATVNDPTVLRVAAPVATLSAVAAGSYVVAREVQGAIFGALHGASVELASALGRLLAIAALLAVLVALGGRAVARSLEFAHQRADEDRSRGRTVRRRTRGLLTLALCVPVGLAAFLWGAPILSLFR